VAVAGPELVGGVLIAGPVLFLVGAVLWRLDYQRPREEALPVIHRDRRRLAWIHSWMVVALVVTPAGLAGLAALLEEPTARVLASMATATYLTGAVCLVVSLTFRLTVVRWAAEQTVVSGQVPEGFAPYDARAGSLYVVHMADRLCRLSCARVRRARVGGASPVARLERRRVGACLRGWLCRHSVRGAVQPALLGTRVYRGGGLGSAPRLAVGVFVPPWSGAPGAVTLSWPPWTRHRTNGAAKGHMTGSVAIVVTADQTVTGRLTVETDASAPGLKTMHSVERVDISGSTCKPVTTLHKRTVDGKDATFPQTGATRSMTGLCPPGLSWDTEPLSPGTHVPSSGTLVITATRVR